MKPINWRRSVMLAALMWCAAAQGAAPIRVACLDVYGTAERGVGPKNMARCLESAPEFTFRTVTSGEIRSNGLTQVDVLICPGGSGSKQSHNLDEQGRLAVQDFVRNGGGYVGFCAGAYLASSHYSWSLALLNAKVVDSAHWARGTGDVTLKLTPEGRRLLGATNEIVTCYYAQGPLLAPDNKTNLPPYQLLATFNSEMAKKGAPTGVMIGTTAIATGHYGKGRVLCFSPHPEKTKGLEDFVRRAVRWAATPAQAKADTGAFKLVGDPVSTNGATWTYEGTDDDIEYKLNGVLFKPAGKGPFPAVLISHGQGNSGDLYGVKVARELVKWGLVCIAPNYTYGARSKAEGAPGAADIRNTNVPDNLKRAHKCLDILRALGYVDMQRVAIHGHSKGAFLSVAIAGAFPAEIRAASHTAGGEQPYNKELSLKIRTPYSIHHGDADTSVALACDTRFDATLTTNKVEHELHIYPGVTHQNISMHATVLERVKAWYLKHGVLEKN